MRSCLALGHLFHFFVALKLLHSTFWKSEFYNVCAKVHEDQEELKRSHIFRAVRLATSRLWDWVSMASMVLTFCQFSVRQMRDGKTKKEFFFFFLRIDFLLRRCQQWWIDFILGCWGRIDPLDVALTTLQRFSSRTPTTPIHCERLRICWPHYGSKACTVAMLGLEIQEAQVISTYFDYTLLFWYSRRQELKDSCCMLLLWKWSQYFRADSAVEPTDF